ncbi:unnamed protein product [Chrysodeixis includens]|uniref:Uncharacterized protein n=1 Tax=Chrysodeixis includens TaxID=689277 RepID=A0A9P0BM35_CHRIL|nr:unnamed protein product [Chrysodeixis includens]
MEDFFKNIKDNPSMKTDGPPPGTMPEVTTSPLKLLMEDHDIVRNLEENVIISAEDLKLGNADKLLTTEQIIDLQPVQMTEQVEVTVPEAPTPAEPPAAAVITKPEEDYVETTPMIAANIIEKATSGFTVLTESKQEDEATPTATWDPIGTENYFVFLS